MTREPGTKLSSLNPPRVGDKVRLHEVGPYDGKRWWRGPYTVKRLFFDHHDVLSIEFEDRPTDWGLFPDEEKSRCKLDTPAEGDMTLTPLYTDNPPHVGERVLVEDYGEFEVTAVVDRGRNDVMLYLKSEGGRSLPWALYIRGKVESDCHLVPKAPLPVSLCWHTNPKRPNYSAVLTKLTGEQLGLVYWHSRSGYWLAERKGDKATAARAGSRHAAMEQVEALIEADPEFSGKPIRFLIWEAEDA